MAQKLSNERRLFGPPGTGKTTFLAKQIEKEAKVYGPDSIIVASFTKAAAAELNSRDLPIPRENCGTLHALCHRAMGSPPIAEVNAQTFNTEFPHLAVTINGESKLDAMAPDAHFSTDGDKFLAAYNLFRARKEPLKNMPRAVENFRKKWENWKLRNDLVDFCDMINYTLQSNTGPPGDAIIGIYDEVQDFNRLEMDLIRHWGTFQEQILLAGDDDQCSVEGTKVLTTQGYVPIEQLDPKVYRLTSYYKDKSEIVGISSRRRRANQYRPSSEPGYGFKVSTTWYTGLVVDVSTGNHSTATNLIHKWPVKWSPCARGKEVVYLMQQGNRFRIGRCTLIRADGCFNFGVRCRMEHADKGWILKVCDSRKEASMWESFLSVKYGIPQVLFREPDTRFTRSQTFLDQEQIDTFWNMLDVDLHGRAYQCLYDHSLLFAFPFWRKNGLSKRGERIMYFQAVNLLPDVMMVADYDGHGKAVKWMPCKLRKRLYAGYVYGLEVDTHQHYIADGIVTHNSIYGFTGASPDAFLYPEVPPDHKKVLRQSWRLPRVIQRFATEWIAKVREREQKEYLPRNEEGEILRLDATVKSPHKAIQFAADYANKGKTVMLLTTCTYMLNVIKQELRRSGLPFHNPYRKQKGDWNPLGSFVSRKGTRSTRERLLAFLNDDMEIDGKKYWSIEDLSLWIDLVKVTGILVRGGKGRIETLSEDINADLGMTLPEFYENIFEPFALTKALARDIPWFKEALSTARRYTTEYPLRVYSKQGRAALEERPRIIISTIHGVKGGEADAVILFPDLSEAGMRSYEQGKDDTDAVIRTFYVGMTRARETLAICRATDNLAVKL